MKKGTTALLWMLGVALLTSLIAYHGISEVISATVVAGWGLIVVSAYYFVTLTADTLGWRKLIPVTSRPSFSTILVARWICGGINTLLPVFQVGGELVRARLIAIRGVSGAESGASVVVDVTATVTTQVVFFLLGIVLLTQQQGLDTISYAAFLGALFLTLLVVLFYFAQRFGIFRNLAHVLERMIKIGSWATILGGAKALDNAINAIYRRRGEFLVACGWRLLGWILGAGEVWLALYFLKHPVTAVEALILESMGQAVRSSAFMVPGAYGVQEGGFIFLGTLVGLNQETGLALSLVKRVREFMVGLPALLIWQFIERQQLLNLDSAVEVDEEL